MILALDISTVQTGYCVGAVNKKPRWGVFRPQGALSRTERIAFMAASVAQLVKSLHVRQVVAEQLSVTSYKRADGTKGGANFKSAEALAECRGVIKHELRRFLLPMTDVNLQSARSKLGIRERMGIEKGGVKKADVIQWLRNNGVPVDNGDEADAIVVWMAVSLGKV